MQGRADVEVLGRPGGEVLGRQGAGQRAGRVKQGGQGTQQTWKKEKDTRNRDNNPITGTDREDYGRPGWTEGAKLKFFSPS